MVSTERGALVTVAGVVDGSAVAQVAERLGEAAVQPDTAVVAVDLSAATRGDPGLFEVLARTDERLRSGHGRLVIVGLHPGLLTALEQADLWAVFPLYRAARERGPNR